jgi:tryptophan halogenase
MKKFLVVGGGTAGIIAATYLKKYYGPKCEVTLLYDHKNPRIGVGESTTPFIWTYLNYLGISLEKLLRETNFTIKLGVKFKNWLGKNDIYWNNFSEIDYWNREEDKYNIFYAYERLIEEKNLNNYQFSSFYTENNLIPNVNNYVKALHLDTEEFSEYILNNYADNINIIDDVVEKVLIDETGIQKIITKNNLELTADIYFDASGFNKLLISKLTDDFIDLSDTLILDRSIPFQIKKTKEYTESYTLSEATKNGWIWQTPLYNRYGSGYLYSSKFTTKEEAQQGFNQWLIKNHGVELESDREIKFISGYYKNAWVKNCVAIGFASGFIEPLESTTIQIIINQMYMFGNIYSGKILKYDQKMFNKKHSLYFENIISYILFHYHTKRTDSEFWKCMTSNMPEWVYDVEEKVKNSILTQHNTDNINFSYNEYSAVCDGLNLSTKEGSENYLNISNLLEKSKLYFNEMKLMKIANRELIIDHRQYLTNLKQ